MNKNSKISFNEIKPFSLNISYSESHPTQPFEDPSHIHNECEIYINLSGDVSFMVENSIYPMVSGNIIITRPFEYHHCIYHGDSSVKHFWILLSSDGNEKILDLFFNRPLGKRNLLVLPQKETDELIKLCFKMVENKNINGWEKYNNFFNLLSLLNKADIPETGSDIYYDDVSVALKYINENIEKAIQIKELSEYSHVSINTLERHFKDNLGINPRAFIRKKQLANAVKLLSQGKSVAEACTNSGFSDFSSFISLFKKNYGVTPLKYKKSIYNK